MTRREAKIEALRLATALLNNPPTDWEGTDYSYDDVDKILDELNIIAGVMEKRAEKLGGEFNKFTGLVGEVEF